jgi:hypothetical protein
MPLVLMFTYRNWINVDNLIWWGENPALSLYSKLITMNYFVIDPKNEGEIFIISDFDRINYWRNNHPECIIDCGNDYYQLAYDYNLI